MYRRSSDDGDYRFTFSDGRIARCSDELANEEGLLFDSSLNLHRQRGPGRSASRPVPVSVQTLRVIAGIHWQAVRSFQASSVVAILASLFGCQSQGPGHDGVIESAFRKALFIRSLKQLRFGSSNWFARGNARLRGYRSGLHATIAIEDEGFFARAVGGTTSVSGILHGWPVDSPDIGAVIRLGIRNLPLIEKAHPILSAMNRLKNRLQHLRRQNTVQGSRANISHHYDLVTILRLLLDRTMPIRAPTIGPFRFARAGAASQV